MGFTNVWTLQKESAAGSACQRPGIATQVFGEPNQALVGYSEPVITQ